MNKKILTYLVIAIAAALLGPLAINWLYQVEKPIIITEWDAVDVLDYYGTILSAIISVLVILITITNEHEKFAIERRNEKKRIEEQRQYENMMEIVGNAADSINSALKEMDPFLLYYIYYDHLLSFRKDVHWLIAMRKDSSAFLNRVRWLINDCEGKIGEIECYNINEPQLRDIKNNLDQLYIDYVGIDNKLCQIGRVMISATKYDDTDFFKEIDPLIITSSMYSSMYSETCSKYGRVTQELRQKIMKKLNTELSG